MLQPWVYDVADSRLQFFLLSQAVNSPVKHKDNALAARVKIQLGFRWHSTQRQWVKDFFA